MANETIMRVRRGTAANWTSTDPVLYSGQIGWETDTRKFKVGDGTTAWSALSYSASGGGGGGDALVANPLSQFAATTSLQLKGVISDETGSGALVFANTPTLVTPVLGAATATSINGLTITSSTGTLTVANGKTATVSNTLTFTGTDGSTLAIGGGGTLGTAAYTAASAYQAVDSELTALAGLTSAADKVPYFTGSGTAAVADFTATGRSIVDDTSVSAVRTTIGVTQACIRSVTIVFNGSGTALAGGEISPAVRIPYSGAITRWTLTGTSGGVAATGSAVMDLWKTTHSTSSVPVVANTITASDKPTISSATSATGNSLTGWTTTVTAGDQIVGKIDSTSTFKELVLVLEITTST